MNLAVVNEAVTEMNGVEHQFTEEEKNFVVQFAFRSGSKEDTISLIEALDCQHFFRQIFLGYFPDIVQAFDTLGRNVYGDDYTSLHNPIVLSSVLLVYGMFHSTRILF